MSSAIFDSPGFTLSQKQVNSSLISGIETCMQPDIDRASADGLVCFVRYTGQDQTGSLMHLFSNRFVLSCYAQSNKCVSDKEEELMLWSIG